MSNVRPVSDRMLCAMIDVFYQPMTEEEYRHSVVIEHVPAKPKPKICRYSRDGIASLAPNAYYNRQGIVISEYLGKGGTRLCKVKWNGLKKAITYPRRYIEIIESSAPSGIDRADEGQAARGQDDPSAAVGVESSEGGSVSQPAPAYQRLRYEVPDGQPPSVDQIENEIFGKLWSAFHPEGKKE